MAITPLDVAQKFLGVKEQAGQGSNPLVLAMLQHVASWPKDDAVAWCAAFVGFVCWLTGMPETHSLAARSWLLAGRSVPLVEATPGYDIVVLKRGSDSPGPLVLAAEGHVGFYVNQGLTFVRVLGGNQADSVSIEEFPIDRILDVRRLLG